jgi:hypothetical protein
VGVLLLPACSPGCDPIVEVLGSFFPAWMLCMVAGVVLTIVIRPAFVRLGIEPHMGPLPLIYFCLGLLLTFATWLVFFST